MSKYKSNFFYRDYNYGENDFDKLFTKCNTGFSQSNYLFRYEKLSLTLTKHRICRIVELQVNGNLTSRIERDWN